MKHAVSILILLITLRMSAFQVTNVIVQTQDDSSWTTPPFGTEGEYWMAGLDCVYPQYTNSVWIAGQSGQNIEGQFLNLQQQKSLPVWCFASSNNVPFWDWVTLNDNGSFTLNDYVNWGTNQFNAPPLFYDGTSVTNEGIMLAGQHIAGSTILNSSAVDGDGGALTRQSASDAINSWISCPASPDVWHDTKTNLAAGVDITDVTGTKLFYTGGHPTPAYSAAIFISRWRQMGWDTNIGSITFNFSSGTVSAHSHFSASNITLAGNTLTCTLLADRMPPAFDRNCPTTPNGVISNNVALPDVFTYFPGFTNVFSWIFQATNLPTGIYTISLDGVVWFMATDAQLAAGYNAAFNTSNVAFNLQRDQLLADARDKNGRDHITTLTTHNAGSLGVGGHADMINLPSIESFYYDTDDLRGPAFVNAVMPTLRDVSTFDAKMYNDAQQTNHTLTIQLLPHTFAPAIAAANPAINIPLPTITNKFAVLESTTNLACGDFPTPHGNYHFNWPVWHNCNIVAWLTNYLTNGSSVKTNLSVVVQQTPRAQSEFYKLVPDDGI